MKRRRFSASAHHGVELYASHPKAMRAFYEQQKVQPTCVANGIAVVSIDGPLEHKGDSFWGWYDSYESVMQRFQDAILATDVRAVVLKIGSPGGDADGLNAHVTAMRRVKRDTGKPVYCYCDDEAYSAAYALACVADEIYLPPGGGCGSIGVIARVVSLQGAYEKAGLDVRLVVSGKRKADGNPDAPITDIALTHVQRRVDQLAMIYYKLVARSRGLEVPFVAGLEADTFFGRDAVRKGLADDVMSLDDVLTYATRRATGRAA